MIEYIVTDPCYILPDNIWDQCCKSLDDGFEVFNETVSKALAEFSGCQAWACDTGYGDWNNEIFGCNVKKSDFCADAGMVCICQLSDKIKDYIEQHYDTIFFSGAAVFEMSDTISVEFNQNCRDWTVITIKDKTYGNTITSTSVSDYYSEDEEEY